MADDIVTLGTLGAPFGVKGWLKLQSGTRPAANILDYQPWQLYRQGGWQQVDIEACKVQNQQIVIKIAGVNDRDAAMLYTHADVGAPASQLPGLPVGEYYWRDLVGLTVIDNNEQVLGTVSQLMETGSNDVLIVKGEEDIAIPFIQGEVILNIDLDKKIISVAWDQDYQ